MPRNRGGSRGGRGGGNGGRFRLSKTQKRKARGKASGHRTGNDMPELMDLNSGVYVPDKGKELPQGSMKSLSRRPNRHMMDEARFTDRHMEQTMKQPLRKRPIEFVKATTLYDPSKDLIEKLANYNKKQNDTLTEHMGMLKMEEDTSVGKTSESEGNTVATHEEESQTQTDRMQMSEKQDELRDDEHEEEERPNVDEHREVLDQMKDEVIEEEDEAIEEEDDEAVQEEEDVAVQEEEDVAVEQEDDVELAEEEEEDFIKEEDALIGDHNNNLDDSVEFLDSDLSDGKSEELDMFVIDEKGDEEILATHNVQKKEFHDVIRHRETRKTVAATNFEKHDKYEAFTEHDPHLTIGHVMLKTTTENGSVEALLPTLNHLNKVTSKGFIDLASDDNLELSEDSDEEAAFEDYMAQLMEVNGADEYEDELDDENLMRLSEEDLDDESIDNQFLGSDEEGLEEILAFARQQKNISELEFPPTQTIKKKGRGKKQKPELQTDLDLEIRESLMEQFQYQKLSRRDKKLRKKEKRQQQALVDNDLSVKYDYSLHIKEIKQEFETFLHDVSRDTMSFPPLDPHGNKTINKLSSCYNMRCTRCGGNGLQMYMKVAKTRKTFHYLPDYNQIAYIMRQRPVFKRSDVKSRTKEEIAETDGKKSRRGPINEAYVKEGDLVGAKAPEIGTNNIGRKLLEKLGWVKGEGLGAHGNKGISEPLMATVKKSKTGLR